MPRDGDTIHAVLRDVGHANSRTTEASTISGAITSSLERSHHAASDVAAVVTGGFGTMKFDDPEAAGLIQAYDTPTRKTSLWIDTVINQLGYSGGAQGMATLLKSIIALNEKILTGAQRSDVLDRLSGSNTLCQTVNMPTRLELQADGQPLSIGVNNLDLEGQACHLILEAAPMNQKREEPAQTSTSRIVRISATTREQLVNRLNQPLSQHVARDHFSADDLFRVAIVIQDETEFTRKTALAERAIDDASTREVAESQGIFLAELTSAPPRIAFLYSGQGSQYPGMLAELVEQSPIAASHLADINRTLQLLELPAFEQLVDPEDNELGSDLFTTQLSVLLADTLLDRTLRSLAIRPDVVSAHSYGEYGALVATGAWSLEEAVQVTRARCDAIGLLGDDAGAMLATAADRSTVGELIASANLSEAVFIANHNSPNQTVLSGTQEGIVAFANHLEAAKHQVTHLPVPGAFHSPLMSNVRPDIRKAVNRVMIRPRRRHSLVA